ncbi:MAG: trigger factor [Desulfitobacterium sp.]|nr:trigger factor [Desulfitobacterium sp.]
MNAVLEKIEKSEAHFNFKVEYKVFEEALDKVYKIKRGNYEVPGFRKGKAPRFAIEAKYGETIFYQEALDMLMPNEYQAAVDKLELKTMGEPDIEVGYIEKGKDLDVKVVVPVLPEVTLGEIEGIEVTIPKAEEVTEKDIDRQLEMLQIKNKKVTDRGMEPAVIGDTVTIDYDCELDGNKLDPVHDYQTILDEEVGFLGFESQLVGKKKGDIVELEKVFPDDFPQKQLVGKTARFQITVKKVEKIETLPLDDTFAQEVGKVKNLEELRQRTREELEQAAHQRYLMARNKAIYMELFKRCKVEIPEFLIMQRATGILQQFEEQVRSEGGTVELYLQMMNKTQEELKNEIWEDAENSLKSEYIMDEVIKEKGYTVTEEEIDEGCREFALSVNMDPENAREKLGPLVSKVEFDLKVEKAFQYVLEHAKITEE